MKKVIYQIAILGALLAVAVYAGVFNPNCQGSRYDAGASTFDCYRAPGNSATPPSPVVEVTDWDHLCLTNRNSLDILVPTNTQGEWNTFKAAVNAGSISNIWVTCPGGGGGTTTEGVETVTGHGGSSQCNGPSCHTHGGGGIGAACQGAKSNLLYNITIVPDSTWNATTKSNATAAANQMGLHGRQGNITVNGQTFFGELGAEVEVNETGGGGQATTFFYCDLSLTGPN